VRPPKASIKSDTFLIGAYRHTSHTGGCTQNKARNGVHFRAKSVQQVRVMFSCSFGIELFCDEADRHDSTKQHRTGLVEGDVGIQAP